MEASDSVPLERGMGSRYRSHARSGIVLVAGKAPDHRAAPLCFSEASGTLPARGGVQIQPSRIERHVRYGRGEPADRGRAAIQDAYCAFGWTFRRRFRLGVTG